jgi:flagellar L-ring protein precursor FlgH
MKIYFLLAFGFLISGCQSNSTEDGSALKSDFTKLSEKISEPKQYANQLRTNPIINSSSISLFTENTNYEIGDIITIILQENTNASKNAKSSTASSNQGNIEAPVLFGLKPSIGGWLGQNFGDANGRADLSVGYGGSNSWSGDGSSSQSNSLNGEIAVFVVGKTKNGNLLVEGRKNLLINQGIEKIILTGVIRPMDIDSLNTILSTKVANANIQYFGDGQIHDSNEMGWLSSMFNGRLF